MTQLDLITAHLTTEVVKGGMEAILEQVNLKQW